jgi:hypothetical protein
VTTFHRYLGAVIVLLFLAIFVWGLVLAALRRDEAPAPLWALQHWTENLLVVQVLTGLVLLVMGRRVLGDALVWLHYLYGSVFPLIAIVGGRISGLRRETREYLGLAWGAFFALGLTLRALQTGCGDAPRAIARCLGFDA